MDASIGVSQAVKDALASVKPPWMTWSELLETLFLVADKEQLQAAIDDVFAQAERTAVEEAKARYHKYRKNPQSLLSAGELKQRLQARRMKERFLLLNEIMTAKPENEWLDDEHFFSLLARTDQDIHDLREWARIRKEERETDEKVA